MKKFIEKVEKHLIRSIALVFVAVILVQGLMTQDDMRLYLSWGERLEGQTIEYPVYSNEEEKQEPEMETLNSPYALLGLSLEEYSSLPRAMVLVNGKEYGSFEDNQVQLKLMAGDVIEIDASYYDFPVKFKVLQASDNLAFPVPGEIYVCNQDVVMIGKIVVK